MPGDARAGHTPRGDTAAGVSSAGHTAAVHGTAGHPALSDAQFGDAAHGHAASGLTGVGGIEAWGDPSVVEINRMGMHVPLRGFARMVLDGAWSLEMFDRPEDVPASALGGERSGAAPSRAALRQRWERWRGAHHGGVRQRGARQRWERWRGARQRWERWRWARLGAVRSRAARRGEVRVGAGVVDVPGNWTMQDLTDSLGETFVDLPHYTNVQMPFAGPPPRLPDRNPCGVYRRTVQLPDDWLNKRIVLHVAGAESAHAVYLDGRFVGYGTDSRLPSEYDLAPFLRPAHNAGAAPQLEGRVLELAIVVFRYSAHSYIEDQDQWWMAGLHRSVWIEARPTVHICDLVVDSDFDPSTGEGMVAATATVDFGDALPEGWSVSFKLEDPAGAQVGREFLVPLLAQRESSQAGVHGVAAGRADFGLGDSGRTQVELGRGGQTDGEVGAATSNPVAHAALAVAALGADAGRVGVVAEWGVAGGLCWSAETPWLYAVTATLTDAGGRAGHTERQRVGLRRVEVRERQLLVNGEAITVCGVNRHDHHPDRGKAVTPDDMRADLMLMRAHNINAVRTSHYPNDDTFYDLCDELGFYVVDEANIECHAHRDTLCDDPSYRDAFLARGARMVQRDRNHPCVILWSLGNESGFGANHVDLAALMRRADPTRPLHYEQAIAAHSPALDSPAQQAPTQEAAAREITTRQPSAEQASSAPRATAPGATAQEATAQRARPQQESGEQASGRQTTPQAPGAPGEATQQATDLEATAPGAATLGAGAQLEDTLLGWVGGGEGVTDVVCPMYPSVEAIREYGESGLGWRPLIMCEYSHAMGNSNGSLADYWGVIHSTPGLQGGFIWEWKDQALRQTDPDGRTRLAWGGQFGDTPNDGNFVADGLVSADLEPHPALAEVAWVHRPVAVSRHPDGLLVQNRRSFLDLSDLMCRWQLLLDGAVAHSGELPDLNVDAQSAVVVALPEAALEPPSGSESHLTVTFETRKDTWFAPAGHVVAWDQIELAAPAPPESGSRPTPSAAELSGTHAPPGAFDGHTEPQTQPATPQPTADHASSALCQGDRDSISEGNEREVLGTRTSRAVDAEADSALLVETPQDLADPGSRRGAVGVLSDLEVDGRELQAGVEGLVRPRLNLWRAATDNDGFKLMPGLGERLGIGGKALRRWIDAGLDRVPADELVTHEMTVEHGPGGSIFTHVVEIPASLGDLPRIGVMFELPARFSRLRWHGRGPHENYPDRNRSALVGIWEADPDELPYLVPQEFGLRTDCRRLELIDPQRQEALRVEAVNPAVFHASATHHRPEDLFRAANQQELRRRPGLVVCIDTAHRGLGTASCGPGVLPRHRINPGQYTFSYRVSLTPARNPPGGGFVA